jgi:hypothetical protein
VRIQFLTRLAKLSPAARQVVMASAVLGRQTTAQQLWQVADVDVHAGIEALEEAVRSGILLEVVIGSGHLASYGFAQELMRQVVLTELGEARRQVLSQRAAGRIESEAIKLPNEQPALSRAERAGLSLAPARRASMPTRSTRPKSEGLLWPLSFQRYGGNIAYNSYEPGFKLALGLKDVNLALEAAKAKQALLPAAEIVRETMLEAVEQGLGSKDWSALAKVTRRRAGLEEAEA